MKSAIIYSIKFNGTFYRHLVFFVSLMLMGWQVNAQQFNYNFDSLKRVIDRQPNSPASAKAYFDYAAKFFFIKSDSGLFYLDKGLNLARQQPDKYLYLFGIKNKADYYSISGDFKKAALIYKQGLAIPITGNTWLLNVKIRGNLGVAYKNMGLLDSAFINYQLVNNAFARHKNNHPDSVAMAFSYMQLYDLYQVQGLMDEAIYYGDKSYELSLKLKAERGIAYGLFIQGLKYQKIKPDLALNYADRSLKMAISKNIPELQQFSSGLKSKILISQNKFYEAKAALTQGTEFTAGSVQQVTYANLADVYYHLNDLPKALEYFKRSYNMAISSGYHAELAEALVSGIAIYEKLKDYKNAYKLQKELQDIQEKIASARLKLDFQRSALKFRTAEKDKELAQKQLQIARQDNRLNRQSLIMTLTGLIILLASTLGALHIRQQRRLQNQQDITLKANREIQTLEAMMKGEETERLRIAKDLHDATGGLLSAVKMRFSTLRNEHPELKVSPSFTQGMNMLDDASAEIRKTAHNLMPDMLTRFGLDEAVQAFCNNMSLRNRLVIDYQSVGDIGRYQEGFELGVYRIVQELVNNIIKHAEAGHALVQFTRQDDLLTISIEDDGKGFSIENDASKSGLGLQSVASRVQTLSGILEIDTAPGKATAVYIEFDISRFTKHNV